MVSICKTTLRICHTSLVTILERRCQLFGEGLEESDQISKRIQERLRRLGLTTLQQRSLRGDLIEIYKILMGKEKVDRDDFFKLQTRNFHNTRGHSTAIN